MAIDPVTGSLILGLGGKLLGGLFGGDGGQKDNLKQRKYEFDKSFGLEQGKFGFDKQQATRKNTIEDVEIGHRRQNTTALSPYVMMLLQSILGRTGAGQGNLPMAASRPGQPNIDPRRMQPGPVRLGMPKFLNGAQFGGTPRPQMY